MSATSPKFRMRRGPPAPVQKIFFATLSLGIPEWRKAQLCSWQCQKLFRQAGGRHHHPTDRGSAHCTLQPSRQKLKQGNPDVPTDPASTAITAIQFLRICFFCYAVSNKFLLL